MIEKIYKKQNLLDLPVIKNFSSDEFFINKSNKVSYNIIKLWPHQYQNTNFVSIYGPRKCGKTHLVNIWAKKNNALIFNSISKKNFNQKYKINSFVFENVEFCSNWPEMLMFNFINDLKASNGFLLITSNKRLDKFEWSLKDLISRFKSFTSIEIKKPNQNLLKKIMIKQFNDRQLSINIEVVEYILRRIRRSYKSVSDMVELIDKFSLEEKSPLTIPLVKKALSNF